MTEEIAQEKKMALQSSGHSAAAHSFTRLAPPLAPVKLGLETSLYTVRDSFRLPEITHLTPLSTGTKMVLHEALAALLFWIKGSHGHTLVCILQVLLLKE